MIKFWILILSFPAEIEIVLKQIDIRLLQINYRDIIMFADNTERYIGCKIGKGCWKTNSSLSLSSYMSSNLMHLLMKEQLCWEV